jgi:hypothetical protein
MTKVKKFLSSKVFFTVLGFAALFYLIADYGISSLWRDLHSAGALSIVLVLTFVPTLVCYALAWLLCSDLPGPRGPAVVNGKRVFIFTRMMAISIAWNNLTPFLKVGGEPAKVLMLKKYLGFAKALESTIIYNLVHALATLLSFILLALAVLLFYQPPVGVNYLAKVIFLLGFSLFFLCLYLPYLWQHWLRRSSVRDGGWRQITWLRKGLIGLCWAVRKTFFYFRHHPRRIIGAFCLEVAARFIEGLTFYFAFYLLNHPISLFSSALLDVGRTLVDTIFFFIPYQVGSREQGVLFFLNDVLGQGTAGYLTATFFYRFVEIIWVMIGYAFWTKSSKAESSLI